VIEPRNRYNRGPQDNPGNRRKPTALTHRKAAVLAASWRAGGTPPGSEKAAYVHRGNSGTCESHVSPGGSEGLGSRPIGEIPGRRRGNPAPADGAAATGRGAQTQSGYARYRGDSEERRNRNGHMAVLADHSSDGTAAEAAAPDRRGSATRATRRSEGEAGHNVPPGGNTEGTQRPLPVATKLRRIAAQAALPRLQGSKVMRQDGTPVLITDEPDELIAHVRVCGGGGPVTVASTRNLTRDGAENAWLSGMAVNAPSRAGYAKAVRWQEEAAYAYSVR